jgi:hypothetical protein
MPRFTLKIMFASMALIATGIAILEYRGWLPVGGRVSELFLLVLWLAAGAFIGAGILLPFKRPFIGVLLGIIVQYSILVMNFILTFE